MQFVETNIQDGQHYIWDFGDNLTNNLSQEKNPFHIYDIPGTFDVTLTVISKHGCKNIVTKPNYITVYPNLMHNLLMIRCLQLLLIRKLYLLIIQHIYLQVTGSLEMGIHQLLKILYTYFLIYNLLYIKQH